MASFSASAFSTDAFGTDYWDFGDEVGVGSLCGVLSAYPRLVATRTRCRPELAASWSGCSPALAATRAHCRPVLSATAECQPTLGAASTSVEAC